MLRMVTINHFGRYIPRVSYNIHQEGLKQFSFFMLKISEMAVHSKPEIYDRSNK